MSVTQFFKITSPDVYLTMKAPENKTSVVTDRRTDTGTTTQSILFEFGGTPDVDFVYLKSKNVTHYNLFGVLPKAPLTNPVPVPATVVNAQRQNVSISQDGFQNFLLPLAAPTADPLRLVIFGSAGAKVFEVAFLKEGYTLQTEERVTPRWSRQRRGVKQRMDARGRIRTIPPLNNEPARWICELGLLYLSGEDEQELFNFLDANPTFAFAGEYSRYPSRVFTAAHVANSESRLEYIAFKAQKQVSLQIVED